MKLYKYISVGFLATLSFSSCSDFLSPDNPSSGNSNGEEYLISNPKDLEATTYNAFSGFVTNISMHDQATDLYINPRGDDGTFARFTVDATNTDVTNYYKNAYKGINYANAMIKYNGEESHLGAVGKFFRALGYYFLTQQFGSVPYVTRYIEDSNRDYPKSPLAEIYENEIQSLEEVYSKSDLEDTNHIGKVSKQAVAALLTQYCLAAGWDLDTEIVDDVKGTYNVKSTAYFERAAAWAEKAINGVLLTMSFAEKWSPFNEGNAEEIFSFQYLRDTEKLRAHSLQNDYIAFWGDCTKTGLKGTSSGGTNMQSAKSLYLFEKGDKRWDATFMNVFYNASLKTDGGQPIAGWGDEGYMAYWNCTPEQLATEPIAYKYWPSYVTETEAEAELKQLKSQIKKPLDGTRAIASPEAAILLEDEVIVYQFDQNGDWTKTYKTFENFSKAGANGVCVKKYDDPQSANVIKDGCYRDIPLYHVSDMYLLAAEAYLLSGKSDAALSKINAVRNRAGLASLSNFNDYEPLYTIPSTFEITPLDLILDERARELYAERNRWFDLKRTKQLVRYNLAFSRSITERSQMCNAAGEVKWLRPIPSSEINANLAMTSADQNPGY